MQSKTWANATIRDVPTYIAAVKASVALFQNMAWFDLLPRVPYLTSRRYSRCGCYCKIVAARSILIHRCLGLGLHVSKPKPTVLLMPGPKKTNAPKCFRLAVTCTVVASAKHSFMPAILRINSYVALDISSYRTWVCRCVHRGSEKLTYRQLYCDALPRPRTQCTQQRRGRRWSSPSHSRQDSATSWRGLWQACSRWRQSACRAHESAQQDGANGSGS